jgi:hypothetical protein
MHSSLTPTPPSLSGIKPNVTFVSSLEPKHHSTPFGRHSSTSTAPLHISRPGLGEKGLSALCSSGTSLFVTILLELSAAFTFMHKFLMLQELFIFAALLPIVISCFYFWHFISHYYISMPPPSLHYQAPLPSALSSTPVSCLQIVV